MVLEKKKSMGTKQFLLDLVQSYIDNKIPKPLVKYASFDKGVDTISIGIDNYYTSKASYKLGEETLNIGFFNGYLASDKENYYISMTKKDILIIDDDEGTFIVDCNNSDMIFNISLKYNFPLTLQDLIEIHNKFVELIDTQEITKLEIFYTAEEEKKYGY